MPPQSAKSDQTQFAGGRSAPVVSFICGTTFLLSAAVTRGGLHNDVFEPGLLVWLILGCAATYYALRVWRPWPGARVLVQRTGFWLTVMGWAAGLMIILGPPHDSHANDGRYQARCRDRLESLGSAMESYAHDHDGHYPDRPDQLLTSELAIPEQFVCPSTQDFAAQGRTPAEVADALASGGHLSYIYVGRGQTTATTRPSTVLMYEPSRNHTREHPGIHVLYAGEHLNYLQGDAATDFILMMRSR